MIPMASRIARRGGVLLLASAIATGSAAMAMAAEPSSPPPAQSSAQPGSEAVQGGIYTIAYPSTGRAWTMSPFWEGSGTQFMQYYLLYDSLAKLNFDLDEWMPSLAESWELAPDGLSLTFTMRDGVTWHDGEPVTADDVEYSVRAWLMVSDAYIDQPLLDLLKGGNAFREGTSEDLGVTATDPSTVRFEFEAPSPLYMDIIMQRPMLPKHVWEPIITRETTLADIGNLPVTQQGIGTGPFKVESFDPEQGAQYVRNPDYFGGAPNLDGVNFRLMAEEISVAAGLEAGEIQGAAVWDVTTYPRLQEVATLNQIVEDAVTGSYHLIPNFRKADSPLLDARFRQAMLYAIPRQDIADTYLQGVAEPVRNLVYAPNYLEGAQITDYSYDPAKAQELLSEIGYDSSQELIFLVQASNDGPYFPAMQQALATVGINVRFVPVADDAGLQEIMRDPNAWDLYYEYISHGTDPSLELSAVMVCPGPDYDPCAHPGFNWTPTEEWDRLWGIQATELDPDARKAAIQDLIAIADQELPTLPLWTEPNVYFLSNAVHGDPWSIYRYGVWSFNDVAPQSWWLEATP
jgi:peptide/nickel transport system substrate-binding protein